MSHDGIHISILAICTDYEVLISQEYLSHCKNEPDEDDDNQETGDGFLYGNIFVKR